MKQVILFIGLSVLLHIARSHDDDVHTIQYTEETFAQEVPQTNHFIMFYAPWCDHCRQLAPTWESLAEKLNQDEDGKVKIGKVDCTTDSGICSENDVTGYPTLKFFKAGHSNGVKFRGTRDIPSLTTFINDQLMSAPAENEIDPSIPEEVNVLVELTEAKFKSHVAQGHHFVKFYAPWCGHCQTLAPTWEELAKTYKHDNIVSISKVDCTQHRSVCDKFDIKGYPTLLWIEDGKKVDKYSGSRTHEDLKDYVAKMLRKSAGGAEDEENGADSSVQSVLTLTGDSFEHGIKHGATFIKFFAPWCGHCKRLAPTWEELGKKFISNADVHIVKVDCTLSANKQLCDTQDIEGFPTLFLYKDGKKVSEYNGSRTLDDLYEFVTKHVQLHDEL